MQQYKYIKGSAEDFVGAPSWAMVAVHCIGSVDFAETHSRGARVHQVDNGYRSTIGNPGNWKLIAQREPIPEWDGDGLPPVGVECETMLKVHGSPWVKFKCLAVDGIAAFGFTGKGHIVAQENTHNFRPIRTEAERKREEAVNAIQQKLLCRNEVAVDFYEHLAAGKIPGIKMEN